MCTTDESEWVQCFCLHSSTHPVFSAPHRRFAGLQLYGTIPDTLWKNVELTSLSVLREVFVAIVFTFIVYSHALCFGIGLRIVNSQR